MIRTITLLLLICLAAGVACVPAPRSAREPLPVWLARVEPLVVENRVEEAVAELEAAAQAYPQAAPPFIRMGQLYLSQQRWLLAEDAFNRALARDLDNPVAMAGLAEALFNQRRLGEAVRVWQKVIALQPQLPGAFTGLGRTQLWLFHFDEAREAFLKEQTYRSDPEANWYLAALTAPRDLAAALEHLNAIPANRVDSERASYRALLTRRDYLLSALAPFTRESNQAEVAKGVGIALTQAQLWPLAVYALTIAREQSRSPVEQAEIMAFLGHALAQSGRPALDLLQEAHELDPTSAWPLYFQGLYLRDQGALGAAERLFREAIALDPDNAAIYVELAQTKFAQGALSEAETLFTTAVEVSGGEAPFQLILAEFYASRGYRLVEAGIPTVEAIIAADEQNAAAHDLLGWMQFLANTGDRGQAALLRALELEPGLVSAHYHYARFLEAAGDHNQARAEYEWVIERDTGGVFRPQAWPGLQRLSEE
jgi:tetratricopeptide (TPR) repeat protein